MIKRIFTILENHTKTILQIIFGLLSILIGIYFIKHEGVELAKVKTVLHEANIGLLAWGILLVLIFVVVQGWMYQYSFKAVEKRIPLKMAILLYLKRNFISVFIPAGLITNLFFFNKDIKEKQGIEQKYIYFASTIFSICSIGSAFLIALPASVLFILNDGNNRPMVIGLSVGGAVLALLVYLILDFSQKGPIYGFLLKRLPKITQSLGELLTHPLRRKDVLKVLCLSFVIELIGIIHLYIAMAAVGVSPSWTVAILGYALVLVILMTSPFLRGIGAIEAALTYALTLYGYSVVSALSAVFLFRFFEFWSLLILGILTLLFKKDGLILQLLAPLLIFFLGVVNILSGLTPALAARMRFLRDFIPFDVIEVSNTTVIITGIVLIVTSIALVGRYRNSYYMALCLTIFSFFGHIFKGIDYEEALLAVITLAVLIYQRKDYFIKSAPIKYPKWEVGIAIFMTILLYGISGFYFLDIRHFNEDFNLWNSIIATLESIILVDIGWVSETRFARYFLLSLNLLGIGSLMYLLWLAFRSFRNTEIVNEKQLSKARQIVAEFGNSSMDYFKTYHDKQFYFFKDDVGFISYKNTKRYTVVLENPVCEKIPDKKLEKHIRDFEEYSLTNNRSTIYYRITENSKKFYENLGKKILLIGEDGIVYLKTFTLVGKNASALRHAVNKMTKDGYHFKVNPPPQTDGFLQQLAYVSHEWLKSNDRSELCFSQGVFLFSELKQQTILSVENTEGKVVAFLNLIPGIAGELNFDLMRKTDDAPNGTMDFLFISMMQHYKEQGFHTVNLGMVPLSGIDEPDNFPERALKLAYEKLKLFEQYKSLRSFKEKFNPEWVKIYIAYDTDLDLINMTTIVNRVKKACSHIQ